MDTLKRGKRTTFANIMAKEKAITSEMNAESNLNKWDYLDARPNWRHHSTLRCECGRVLRYQYIVQNTNTKIVKKFGDTHFVMHTGISSRLAKEILKGFEWIDYELDEVLQKISEGWSITDEGIQFIPQTIEVPSDIQAHFDNEIPLLKRQVRRVQEKISIFLQKCRELKLLAQAKVPEKREKERLEIKNAVSKSKWWQGIKDGMPKGLDKELQLGIILYLKGLDVVVVIASDVCKELASNYGAPSGLLSSGSYKIFPYVCMYLE